MFVKQPDLPVVRATAEQSEAKTEKPREATEKPAKPAVTGQYRHQQHASFDVV